MAYLGIYLAAVGLTGVLFLCVDKYKATHEKWRIKERTLHLWEFLGGVFLMLPAMYVIRHKCRKAAYFWLTYTALVLWSAALYLFFKDKIF